jgi:hypothetical protein
VFQLRQSAEPGGQPRADSGELESALRALERWGAFRDWLGPDPYEGLNAHRAPLIRRSAYGRRVLVQVVKRSPIDLRRPLAITPEDNAAGVAALVSAYARDRTLPAEDRRPKLARMLERLQRLRLRAFERPCWGYHFDVETRVFFYPRTRPNTIATAFAGHALLDAYEATGDAQLLEQAAGVGDFFLEDIGTTETPAGSYFGYFIGDRTPIHNANMLVCGLLARLTGHASNPRLAGACAGALRFCIEHQRANGSWPYGETAGLEWVDGFHTGYVLDALLECERAGVGDGVSDAIDRGLAYYRDHLFLEDGTPKYYDTGVYPIDSQCVAQGIQTFARATTQGRDHSADAWRVFFFAQRAMRRRDGAFVFQRRRYWTNRTPHIRWTEAPMFLALVDLARATR